MKHYCVTYYDGKGKKNLFVKANSSNQAVAEAKERLRTNKVIGATIVGAERLKACEMPMLVINKSALGNMSVEEFAKIYSSPSPIVIMPKAELPSFEKSMMEKIHERFSKRTPMHPRHIAILRKQGIDLLGKRRK